MDYKQLELIAEASYLHALWHLGPPPRLRLPYFRPQPPYFRPQPPYFHPQPPYFRPQPLYHRPFPPSSSAYIAQHSATPASSDHYGKGRTRIPCSVDPPASSSEASPKLLSLPAPEIKKRRLCQGEGNPGEGTTDSSCTLPFKKRLSRGVSNKDIVSERNMDRSAVVMVILEGEVYKEQWKAEVKAVFDSEDGLADGNNLVGGKELLSSDAQVLLAEETVNHGDMKDSMDVIFLGLVDKCEEKGNAEEPAHDGDKEGSVNVTISCQHDAWETQVIVNEGDKKSPKDVTVSCHGDTWDAVKVVNEGDKESSMDVTVSCQGDTWEAEEIVNEGDKKGSMEEFTVSCQGNILGAEKIVHDRDKEEPMNVTVSCQHHAGEAQDMVNEGDTNGLQNVIVPGHEKGELEKIVNEGDMEGPMDVLRIVEAMNMESLIAVTVNYDGEVCKQQGKEEEIVNKVNIVGPVAVTVVSDDEKTDDDDGKKQGLVDTSVSEASKEKAKAKVLQEDGGAGTNDSTSNGSRWALKKCSDKSCGLKLSEARFVLYDVDDGSHILQLPTINLANTQALDQSSALDKYTGGVEAVRNLVWGNTFFASRRTAKLLGHILAGGFQFTPSFPDTASISQPPAPPSARKPKPRTCKLKARVYDY